MAIVPFENAPPAAAAAALCRRKSVVLGKELYDTMSHAQIVPALVARDAQLRYALANKRKLHQVVRRVRQKQDDQLVPVTSKACDLVANS